MSDTDSVTDPPVQVYDVVGALLDTTELKSSRLLLLDANETVMEAPSGRVVRVMRTPLAPKNISKVIDYVLTHNPPQGSELILVGGGPAQAVLIEQALPKLRLSAFFLHHLSDEGAISSWPRQRGHVARDALSHVRGLSHRQEQELFARAAFDQTRAHDEQRERHKFFQAMQSRKYPVTLMLMASILCMFGLQLLWSDNVLAALGLHAASGQWEQYWLVLCVSMGALWAPSFAEGEWWRAISVGFLHFNLMHIAANTFVLYVLGRELEKVLSSSRLIIIYTVALLGGSLASASLTEGVAVGASGAIWGLLGAQVALGYGRPPVLPESVARAMKPMAMRNLILNVGISFIGGIDWAAHFGGGLAGGLLLASGVLHRAERGVANPHKQQRVLAVLACGSAVMLATGVGVALWVGQPWRLAARLVP